MANEPDDDWSEPGESESAMPQVMTSSALEVITRAEIDIGVETAKKYPRDLAMFSKNLMAIATSSVDIAEKMFYQLPRMEREKDKSGKWVSVEKIIEGPSVRLAEAVQACYGNLHSASRIVDVGQKMVVAQGGAHDLQSNSKRITEVARGITGKTGKRFPEHLVVQICNAAQQVAWRNAVLLVVPRVLYWPAYEAARQLVAGQATDDLLKRWPKALAYFQGQGLTEAQLLALLGINDAKKLTGDLYAKMVGWSNGIKAHEFTIAELLKTLAPDEEPAGHGSEAQSVTVESLAQPQSVTAKNDAKVGVPIVPDAEDAPPVDVSKLAADIDTASATADLSREKGAELFAGATTSRRRKE